MDRRNISEIDNQEAKPKKNVENVRNANKRIKPMPIKGTTALGRSLSELVNLNNQSLPEERNKKRGDAVASETEHIDKAIDDYNKEKEKREISNSNQPMHNKIINPVYKVIDNNIGEARIFGYNSASTTGFFTGVAGRESEGFPVQESSIEDVSTIAYNAESYTDNRPSSEQLESIGNATRQFGEIGSYIQQSDTKEPSDLTQELHEEYQRILSDFNRVFSSRDEAITRLNMPNDQALRVVKQLRSKTKPIGSAGMTNEMLSSTAHSLKNRSKSKSGNTKEQHLVMVDALRWLRDSFKDKNDNNSTRIAMVKMISRELEPLEDRMNLERKSAAPFSTHTKDLIDVFNGNPIHTDYKFVEFPMRK